MTTEINIKLAIVFVMTTQDHQEVWHLARAAFFVPLSCQSFVSKLFYFLKNALAK